MNVGRFNIIAGAIFLSLAAFGGFILGFTMEKYFESGFYTVSYARTLLKAGHTHGMPLAFYNLIVGLMVDRLNLNDQWKKRCSLLAMFSFLMPLGLVLRGFTGGTWTFAPVVMIGALCLLGSIGLILKGATRKNN